MDLYTLTDTFLAKDVVEEFVSAIWTERYTSAGDFQIVTPITAYNLDLLAEGTYLALRGSKEVMIVENQSLENGLMTVTGPTFITELNERYLWAYNPADSTADQRVVNYSDDTKKPGEFISNLVTKWAISPAGFPTDWADANLDWAYESIPDLTLGPVDSSGTAQRISANVGPLYDALQPLAAQYGVGISLYLASADPIEGYSLQFKTYQGLDRTSGQEVNPLVRLSLEMEGISDVKELRSIAGYKNVVYVYYQGKITKHLLDPEGPEPVGLDRKVLVADTIGQPAATGKRTEYGTTSSDSVSSYPGGALWGPGYVVSYVTDDDVAAFRAQLAKDAFANHNYIRALDGQASPFSDYKFGTDYGLGDILELEGLTGIVSNARVTEFIRSQDQNGDKEYPTISVLA